MLGVFAKNYKEARYLHDLFDAPLILQHPDDLYGWVGLIVLYYGDYAENPLYRPFDQLRRALGFPAYYVTPMRSAMPKYDIGDAKKAEILDRFTYHAPFDDQPERYERLREVAREFALLILDYTPSGREQALALTKLEECVMHANSAIARNERPPDPA